MSGRICIPIENAEGELVAYAGRWIGQDGRPDAGGQVQAPEGFHKGLELFNLHRVKRTRHLVVVEGYFSVVRLHGLAVPSVALMGSSMSEEQITRLREHCPALKAVTLLLDGEDAGRRRPRRSRRGSARTGGRASPRCRKAPSPIRWNRPPSSGCSGGRAGKASSAFGT
jgi:DNA primase